MSHRPYQAVLHHLGRLLGRQEREVSTDAELLERFVAARDEAAFESLVRRHGGLVLGVCRRVLRSEQDVEDAFQATFLALVRKAGSVSKGGSVGSWLYKVAYRVALEARRRAVRRAAREQPLEGPPAVGASCDVVWRDLRPVLDEEVSRLPAKYRVPFLLCHLEGKTTDEAARQLGMPRGTVGTRVARARERLRSRLTRRGVALSSGLFSSVLAERLASAAVPASLVSAAVRAASASAAGPAPAGFVSASVITLVEGVCYTMFVTKLKNAVLATLLLGLVGSGTGVLASRLARAEPGEEPAVARPAAQDKAKPPSKPSPDEAAALAARLQEAAARAARLDVAMMRVQLLMKAQLKVATEEVEAREKEFQAGRGTLDLLLGASRRLLQAQTNLSKTKEDRVAALERHLRLMTQIYEMNLARFQAGRIGVSELKESEFYRLEAEIEVERENLK